MMRGAWLAAGALVIAIAIQLSVLNGLRLPGGGVPDLVLVLVTALAIAEGPIVGMVFGFSAGLCLDVAPPGSPEVGLYALVLCLAGWAAGRLSPVSGHSDRSSSGLVSVGLLAVVVAAAEALAAGLSLVLAPAEVTLSQVRRVLPASIGYDLILCPFVLYLVVLGRSLVADRTGSTQKFQGVVILGWNASRGWWQPGAQTGQATASRGSKRRQRKSELWLRRGAGHRGDGWVKANRIEAGAHRQTARTRRAPRLRPESGVAGSASGLIHPQSMPAAVVHMRFGAGRRRDAFAGSAPLGLAGLGRHPGALAGRTARFRPHAGAPAGSATLSPRLAPPRQVGSLRPARLRFTGHRGDGTIGRPPRPGRRATRRPARMSFAGHRKDGTIGRPRPRPGRTAPQRPARISFAGHRRDGTVGHALTAGRNGPAVARRSRAAIRFSGHRGDATLGHTLGPSRPDADGAATSMALAAGSLLAVGRAGVPQLKFGSGSAQVSRRAAAVPKFHHKSGLLRSAGRPDAVLAGGVLAERAAAASGRRPAPRLRLSGGTPGMLGGSGRGPRLGRPPGRARKQPRFSYGRRSRLSVLAAGRLRHGGRGGWLARQRAGRRSGVWLIANRGGGPR